MEPILLTFYYAYVNRVIDFLYMAIYSFCLVLFSFALYACSVNLFCRFSLYGNLQLVLFCFPLRTHTLSLFAVYSKIFVSFVFFFYCSNGAIGISAADSTRRRQLSRSLTLSDTVLVLPIPFFLEFHLFVRFPRKVKKIDAVESGLCLTVSTHYWSIKKHGDALKWFAKLMLLTVEGAGFFSSSASAYSKGLTLLLLGKRSDNKSMRILPWNQFQLVGQDSDHKLQLASRKNLISSECASFVCFGRASAGVDTTSHLKVGPAKHHDVSSGTLASNEGKYPSSNVNDDSRQVTLKSSLKRQETKKPAPVEAATKHEALGGKGNDAPGQIERRKVQWTDGCGSELVEIHEFEPSEEDESVDEFSNGSNKTCSCAIIQNSMVDDAKLLKLMKLINDILGQLSVVKTLTTPLNLSHFLVETWSYLIHTLVL
ncbi:hypothetical protein VNO78_33042 [Psophocarpus tetragonolobus]|uniref:Uncharacterized protein n=1 Tax=Psophocarpus tetragonolobus TaxID=3891 RepID=A0AAN9P1N3_PSOTE